MKKKDDFIIFHGLNSIRNVKAMGAFAYAAHKNLKQATSECQSIESANEMSEEFKEYANKRFEIAKTLGTVSEQNVVNISPDKQEELDELLKPLNEMYKDAIDNRRKQGEAYLLLLEEDSNLVLHKVSATLLPDGITPEQVDAISYMLED